MSSKPSQSQTQMTLMPILQRQGPSQRITLNDMYIGDLGAKVVAEFLSQHPNIQVLDLKGNNIGPVGLIDIFTALKKNISLKQLNLQWNNICLNNNLQALEFLYQVLSINKSLVHLDLQNNRLGIATAGLIANIIRNNPQLRSLDLRWNELGNNGVRLLIAAAAANSQILTIEVQGNGATEDTLRELNQVLGLNRDNSRQHEQRDRGARYTGNQRQPLKEMAQHLEEERRAVGRHLEKMIENERMLGLRLKEEYEEKVGVWKQKLIQNQLKIEACEKNINELTNFKNINKADIQRLENQLKDLQAVRLEQTRRLENELLEGQEKIEQKEKRQHEELSESQRVNFMQLKEIDNEQGRKCEQLMDQNRALDDFNQTRLSECNSIRDQITKFGTSSHSETMEVIEKVKLLVLNEFKEKLRGMETQVEEIDRDRLRLQRSHQEKLAEAQREYKQVIDQLADMVRDKAKLETENRRLLIEQNQLELISQSIQRDLQYRVDLEKKIEKELEKIKEKDFKITDHEVKQLNQINLIYANDLEAHNKFITDLKRREEELVRTVQTVQNDNNRLAKDMNNLIETLQANSSKAIYSTFSEQKVI